MCSSSIFTGDGEGGSGFAAAAAAGAAAAAAAAAGGAGGFEFGVDPNLDPELALALRVSMEEERARQEAAAKRAADEASKNQTEGGESSGQGGDVAMMDASPVVPVAAADKGPDFMVCSFQPSNMCFEAKGGYLLSFKSISYPYSSLKAKCSSIFPSSQISKAQF